MGWRAYAESVTPSASPEPTSPGPTSSATPLTWEAPQWHASIDSTNLAAARDPRPGRVIIADHQSSGLGRRGRTWTAPPDTSIAITVVLPAPDPRLIGWVPLAAGLAVSQAIEDSRYAVRTGLKWPNDVLAQGLTGNDLAGSDLAGNDLAGNDLAGPTWGKISGVLCEAITNSLYGPVLVLGAGINIDQTRQELPVDTATSWRLARAASPEGAAPLPEGARAALVDDYLRRLATLVSDLGAVRTAYLAKCLTIGQQVRVHLPGGGQCTGLAAEVDDSGALVVLSGQGQRNVLMAGDVVHVRPAG